jgi:Transglutaminase-like superfamily
MTYYLTRHSYVAPAKRHFVFLDSENDRYFTVDRPSVERLSEVLSCWDGDTKRNGDGTAEPLLSQLVSQNVLSADARRNKPFRAIKVTPPQQAMRLEPPRALRAAVKFSAFYIACKATDRMLRTWPMREVLSFVEDRKARKSHNSLPISTAARTIQLNRLTSTFLALRLCYPRPYLCLFDSLALLQFLSRYDFFPTWIFGVRADPFKAHCWIQEGDLLLNDSVARVRTYYPIMSL